MPTIFHLQNMLIWFIMRDIHCSHLENLSLILCLNESVLILTTCSRPQLNVSSAEMFSQIILSAMYCSIFWLDICFIAPVRKHPETKRVSKLARRPM